MLNQENIFIPINAKTKLGVKKIFQKGKAQNPIVLIHGSAENGRIFYSKSLKGFAPYLAQNGHTVYVVDLRGKGLSTPHISKKVNFSQLDVIKDLKLVFDYVKKQHPGEKQIWGSHSWGGVLINCFMLRFDEVIQDIKCNFNFATKRSIHGISLKKIYMVHFGFNFIMSLQARLFGKVSPLVFGIESEAKDYHLDLVRWVRPSAFIDLDDGFNYEEKAKVTKLPRALYLSASDDPVLGNPADVDAHIKECHLKDYERWHLEGYDHNTILTSKNAINEHFPRLLEWLSQ
tara:strand:- start:77787 stop:78650 length:864 start_codon:yes stop_codon:yes gene_type:complete